LAQVLLSSQVRPCPERFARWKMPEAAQPKGDGNISLGDLYSKCVQLVNENKISTKNAFDLQLIEHMDDIVDSFMGGSKRGGRRNSTSAGSKKPAAAATAEGAVEESRFHEASCTIEASARIYACRVDCVHTDTYRILGGLNTADLGPEAQEGEDVQGNKKRRRVVGVNTLERNEANIVQQNIDNDEQSDPMFRRMAASFDAGGAKGLLLNHLPTAEDLSLVFNADIPLTRAALTSDVLFAKPKALPTHELGLGDPAAAIAKFKGARLCPEVDAFRRQLYGDVTLDVSMPDSIAKCLESRRVADLSGAEVDQPPAPLSPPSPAPGIDNIDMTDPQDSLGAGDGFLPLQDAAPLTDAPMPEGPALPLADADRALGTGFSTALGGSWPSADTTEDAIAFDELFEKFCGAGGSHQFAYFDECWSKVAKDKDGQAVALADAAGDGVLAPVSDAAPGARERAPKRPLFDLTNLDQPAKVIETEPCHKHQLSERAAQWALHKDVPPYMIDRITMPSWPTWSRCDFACLGLRPHLMLKLVKKPPPPGEGPHCFSDLFSTVVVENPDAFPWLGGARGARFDEDEEFVRPARDTDFADDGGDEDFDAQGLPAHLDVDPQELFLRPEDQVLPDCEEMQAADDFDTGDLDLADQPQTVGSVDIGYSRNSKFVDVKLVKKHLWDCISDDIAHVKQSKPEERMVSSFQTLVNRTVERLPKGETENLSVAVCFICQLHLCNEKGVELEVRKPLGDFDVVNGPQ